MSADQMPADDELEVSVFGRGFGEAIVCHLGNQDWIVVDSLCNSDKRPVALDYLQQMGVNWDCVKSIVLTHWHDDHVRGAAEIVRSCPNANVTMPITLREDEFKNLLRVHGKIAPEKFTNGVEELRKILELLNNGGGHRLQFAGANMIVLEAMGKHRLEALSPSHKDIEEFFVEMNEWSSTGTANKCLSPPNRNDTSVVLAIHALDNLILLGGDLEVTHKLGGWANVHGSAWRDRGVASLFKISHHGSHNGHYDPLWTDCLVPNPATVLTPFNRGKRPLPHKTDVERILNLSNNSWTASTLNPKKGRKESRSVERTLSEANIKIYREPKEVGLVRFRKSTLGTDWNIEIFNSACHLSDLAA